MLPFAFQWFDYVKIVKHNLLNLFVSFLFFHQKLCQLFFGLFQRNICCISFFNNILQLVF